MTVKEDEFKKSLRSQLRERARAGYGKPIKSLTKKELKISLDVILRFNYSFWKLAKYGDLKQYKELFCNTFENELKLAGIMVKS